MSLPVYSILVTEKKILPIYFIMESLDRYSRFEIPEVVKYYIEDNYSRFGAICFEEYDDDRFLLTCSKDIYRTQLLSIKSLLPYLENGTLYLENTSGEECTCHILFCGKKLSLTLAPFEIRKAE